MNEDDTRPVRLPAELCKAIERRFANSRGGLETFLTLVMRELLRDQAAQMDKAEQQVLEQRLKDLGYL